MSLQGAEMMTSQKRLLILTLLVASAASSAQNSTTPFTLSLEAVENSVQTGSHVKVDITLRNSSKRSMHISYGLSELDYDLEVRDSQKRIAPETEYARKSKGKPYFSNDQVFYLQPGESLPKAPLVVSMFYDLSRPGNYKIQVSRTVLKELGGGTIKSNVVSFTIRE
jgi:hypothetical protein